MNTVRHNVSKLNMECINAGQWNERIFLFFTNSGQFKNEKQEMVALFRTVVTKLEFPFLNVGAHFIAFFTDSDHTHFYCNISSKDFYRNISESELQTILPYLFNVNERLAHKLCDWSWIMLYFV